MHVLPNAKDGWSWGRLHRNTTLDWHTQLCIVQPASCCCSLPVVGLVVRDTSNAAERYCNGRQCSRLLFPDHRHHVASQEREAPCCVSHTQTQRPQTHIRKEHARCRLYGAPKGVRKETVWLCIVGWVHLWGACRVCGQQPWQPHGTRRQG